MLGELKTPQTQLRSCTVSDLPVINQVLVDAIGAWKLTERLQRLTLPLLCYQEQDFKTMSFVMAEGENAGALGFLGWHSFSKRAGLKDNALNLHGLYIRSSAQQSGLGRQLLQYAEDYARSLGAARLELKAWRNAEDFFRKYGFTTNPDHQLEQYPVPLSKPV